MQYRITWYGPEFAGQPLACGSDIYGLYDPADPTTAAANWGQHVCGERLRVCTKSVCLTVIVKDRCGGCGYGHIDLSQAAYNRLGGYDYANVAVLTSTPPPITNRIQLPETGNGGYIDNRALPVVTLTLSGQGGFLWFW